MFAQKQHGISLLEVFFSLVIMAVILVIVANYYYSQNQRYMQVTQAATQIQQLANVAYEWQTAQQQVDFTGIDMSTLQNAGLLTNQDHFSQIDPWGGTILLNAAVTDPRYVQITLPKIPAYACANLRDRMTSVAHDQTSEADCKKGSYQITM